MLTFFELAAKASDPKVATSVVGFGLDAIRFSARLSGKAFFPQGLGNDHGAEFAEAAMRLADNLRQGSTAGALELASLASDEPSVEDGSAAAARLFELTCVSLDEIAAASADREIIDRAFVALAHTLDGAALTISVIQSDDNWNDVASKMARSGAIDEIYRSYLSFGGLSSEFLSWVAVIGALGRDDRAQMGIQISENYEAEAAESRRTRSFARAIDLAHHVNSVASYARTLRNEPHGADEEHRQRANEIAISCGSRLLRDALGNHKESDPLHLSGLNYAFFFDSGDAGELFQPRGEPVDDATTWLELVRADPLLQAFASAIDARTEQAFVDAPIRK